MATLIIMPRQGQSVESCIITEIKKKNGDYVEKGDILFSYETDKASFEESSPVDGFVLACFYGEGDEVPVLDNMMIIGDLGEDISSLLAERPAASLDNETASPYGDIVSSGSASADLAIEPGEAFHSAPCLTMESPLQGAFVGSAGVYRVERHAVTPRAGKLAERHSLDASVLQGSGPGGRVMERDVESALEKRPKMTALAREVSSEQVLTPLSSGSGLGGRVRASDLSAAVDTPYGVDYEDRKISNMRKLIARSMHFSLQNSAQLTHHLGADARRILSLRKRAKAAHEGGLLEENITLNDMVCFAVIKALKKFPNVNSHFLGEKIRYFNKVHLGLAVDTDRGLMVPVVRNADDLSLPGLSLQLKEVASACRGGSVNPDILASESGTFTVSNLGNYGVEMFTPVINLPQSAILGVNTIVPRPKDLGDGVYAFVPYIGLSLTYDHRSLDGGEATRFLKQIATEIENLEIDVPA
ncbi:MAG: dihydrolipoamide acetyltransferase family protein [Proteiniphilum sp.]|nr:dihydrolipoamide acetyltransferase family protein [Proteiniphilum sp.]MDD4415578.1 dihydrolipoamide acetyltransferase family protein [Proteiniphilum sp.]